VNAPLRPLRRVLPTLNADGTRYPIRPEPAAGRWHARRRWVGLGLVLLFVALPFVTLNRHPVVLFDLPRREFHLLGRTFLPTDSVLLMILILAIFVSIFWITALLGRAWCGWGCPQTVYLEFIFRPIERWIEGGRSGQIRLDRAGGGWRRALKFGVFVVLSAALGNLFLSYFVGIEALRRWVSQSPYEHPGPFLVMFATTALVYFDFAYFREQMCTVICPYAKLQSVLLDTHSLIVGYDHGRGDVRGSGKNRDGLGDCIDCGACVRTCPTGIDIRDGLQLECVACAQCMDACDSIMRKIGKPEGLVRYVAQQDLLAVPKAASMRRPRLVMYPLALSGLLAALFFLGKDTRAAEVTVLRGLAAPFVVGANGVTNQIRVKVRNRSEVPESYRIELVGAPGLSLVAPENPLHVPAGEQQITSVFVIAPIASFQNGALQVLFVVSAGQRFHEETSYRLLGPKFEAGKKPLP